MKITIKTHIRHANSSSSSEEVDIDGAFLIGPLTYVYFLGDICVYVGASKIGVERPLRSRGVPGAGGGQRESNYRRMHKLRRMVRNAKLDIIILPKISMYEAEKHETQLRNNLRPIWDFNKETFDALEE